MESGREPSRLIRKRIVLCQIRLNISIKFDDDRPVFGNLRQSICVRPGLKALERLVRKQEIFENATEPAIFQRQAQNSLVMTWEAVEDALQDSRICGSLRHRSDPAQTLLPSDQRDSLPVSTLQ